MSATKTVDVGPELYARLIELQRAETQHRGYRPSLKAIVSMLIEEHYEFAEADA